jgi:hypothetical protein
LTSEEPSSNSHGRKAVDRRNRNESAEGAALTAALIYFNGGADKEVSALRAFISMRGGGYTALRPWLLNGALSALLRIGLVGFAAKVGEADE